MSAGSASAASAASAAAAAASASADGDRKRFLTAEEMRALDDDAFFSAYSAGQVQRRDDAWTEANFEQVRWRDCGWLCGYCWLGCGAVGWLCGCWIGGLVGSLAG